MAIPRIADLNPSEWHERAKRVLPMGVNGDGRYSPPFPLAFVASEGKWLHAVDGKRYLDLHGGFGTAILGYSHPEVDATVVDGIDQIGTVVGLPHPWEVELAERLCQLLPAADRVALCGGGGSDAIYHCVRLARAGTGRDKIIKVEGGYHGWHGVVGASVRPSLDQAGDARHPKAISNSPGIVPGVIDQILVVSVNDPEGLEQMFAAHGHETAAVVLEPALYSAGCIPVDREYLQLARRLCDDNGSVLIFDEVMSGFRNGMSGAGGRAQVNPDLGAYGKAVGNGYMISFLAGRAELMTQLAPEGPVFYSGTFNGHPLSVLASLATLDVLEREQVPPKLWALGDRIAAGVNAGISEVGARAVCQAYGSVFCVYFGTERVHDYRDLAATVSADNDQMNDRLRLHMRDRGIYFHKRQTNRCFLGAAHAQEDADWIVEAIVEFVRANRSEIDSLPRA